MKKIGVLVLLMCISVIQNNSVFAQDGKLITRQKKISRHYKVNPTDSLIINNGFGNVIINTWDKNEVTVDISETAKAKTKKRTEEIIDSIEITEGEANKGSIYFKTAIWLHGVYSTSVPASNSNWEADVTYRINAPKNIILDVHNTNGNVNVGDFNGPLNINILHGALHAKNISGSNKTIAIIGRETSAITSIKAGKVSGDGDLVITKPIDAGKVVLDGWSKITIDNKLYNPVK